jgi:hypothetical protein
LIQTRASSAPHLDRHLSLDQTHTFNYVGIPEDHSHNPPPSFPPNRSSTSFPVRVDTVRAHFPHVLRDPARRGSGVVFTIVATGHLLSLFDPRHLFLSSDRREVVGDVPPLVELKSMPWTRLELLSVTEIEWEPYLNEASWFARLPPRSLTLVYANLGEEDYTHGRCELEVVGHIPDEDDVDQTRIEDLFSVARPAVKELVIECESEQHMAFLQDGLEAEFIEMSDTSAEERERRGSYIRWVITDR